MYLWAWPLLVTTLAAHAGEPLRFDFTPSYLPPVEEHQPKTLACRRCEAAPVVDGMLGEGVWRKMQPIRLRRRSRTAPETQVRVCFDDRHLYLGVTCLQRAGIKPVADAHPRDGRLWKDDHVEIWLDPTGEMEKKYQFVLSAGNAIYDLLNGDASYDPPWQHAVAIGDGKWTQEIAISKEAIGLSGWVRDIGFNIGRNGPRLQPHSWVGAYGQTTDGQLVLEGITRTASRLDEAEREQAEGALIAVEGQGLLIHVERPYARPGERFVEVGLSIQPPGRLDQCRVTAAICEVTDAVARAQVSVVPTHEKSTLLVDLRSLRMRRARLAVELYDGEKRLGVGGVFVHAQECEAPLEEGRRIAVKLDAPDDVELARTTPVTFGAPFAAGALWDKGRVRLVDSEGSELSHQTEVMARWAPEGSVKWLRFDTLVDPRKGCFIEVAQPTRPAQPLRLVEDDNEITIDTGAAQYVLAKGISPIRAVRRSARQVATCDGTRGLFLVDQKGRLATAVADEEEMEIEARGPVAACVRFEGWYQTGDGEKIARHITRVECFAGEPTAQITHTLVLTRDTNEVWLKEVGWELAVDPGGEPRALFGKSRADWRAIHAEPLQGETVAAYLLQDEHYFFAHGRNHFAVAAEARGKWETRIEGEECGDWAALSGSSGGLGISCKDAARQHPKEFEIRRDRVVMHLFSNRVGEELDFRASTLVKKWDLKTWYEATHSPRRREKGYVEKGAAATTNAIGWAKTHQLTITPLAADTKPAELAQAAHLQARPVYALVDPWAIYESKAMGPIYPSMPERWPMLEKAAMAAFQHFKERDAAWGENGLVDYFAGPHLRYSGKYVGMFPYCYNTYTLRSDIWLLYARTGSREVRAFAEGTNRTFMDAIFAHWDGEQTVQGMYRSSNDICFSLPFYWGSNLAFEVSSSSNHDNMMLYYYLTGYRRAADCVREYAEGVKRAWTPAKAAHTWRPLMLFRLLTQAYTFTHDPVLRAMAEETFERFVDFDTALGLSKEFRPYQSTSYKTNVDNRAIIEGWQVFGKERYRKLAHRLAEYWWQLLGTNPIIYTNPQPRIGSFLYNETGKDVYADLLALQLRRAARTYDPETGALRPETRLAAHNVSFYWEGVPYALDVVTRAGADKRQLASWIGYDDVGQDTSIIVHKTAEQSISLQTAINAGDVRTEAIGGIQVDPLSPKTAAGFNLIRISENAMDFQGYHSGSAEILIPKDAPACEYEVRFARKGMNFLIADSKIPLVLHAPGYWQPTLLQTPPARYYFGLPEGSKDAQIFFEGSATLFEPDGAPAFGGEPQRGWINLPADRPGTWSFEIVENKLVRVRNVPPFFAMGDPACYFTPGDKPWSREPIPEPPRKYPADMVYGPGAIDTPGNQSLYATGNRALRIDPGEPHPSGDGSQFLPFKQGTVEFWMKPTWSSVDLVGMYPALVKKFKGRVSKKLCMARIDTGKPEGPYDVTYTVDGPKKELWASFLSDGKEGRLYCRAWRSSTLFERGEWVHIAWVWGQVALPSTNKLVPNVLTTRLFVNGRARKQRSYRYPENLPASPMTVLYVGYPFGAGNTDAFLDEIRVSDVQRYAKDFIPPRREVELRMDEHTRALFHLNGDIRGVSASGVPVAAKLGR